MVRPDQEAALNQDENTRDQSVENKTWTPSNVYIFSCIVFCFFLFKTLILRLDYHECLSAIKPELQGLCAFALLYTPILLVTEYSF